MDGTGAYRNAGVDLQLGNDASKILGNAAKLSWENRTGLGEVQDFGTSFSSLRAMPLDILGLPELLLGAGADGIGNKVEAAERMEEHRTIAHDLIAMSCDDAVVRGGEPFAVATILDVRTFNNVPNPHDLVTQLALGYLAASGEVIDEPVIHINSQGLHKPNSYISFGVESA